MIKGSLRGFVSLIMLITCIACPLTARAQSVPPSPQPQFVEPSILFSCSTSNYFRPVISGDGSYVIFESTPSDSSVTNLVIAAMPLITSAPSAFCALERPFVSTSLSGGSQRADWCWDRSAKGSPVNGPVAFSNGDGVFIASPSGVNSVPAKKLNGTQGMIYPSWYPDCQKLAVDVATDNNPQVTGQWFTAKIDLSGRVLQSPLGGQTVWAGFPSVNQKNPLLVAFAGQSNGKLNGSANYYNQKINYAWVTDRQNVYPLERQINPTSGFTPKFQARAGWWSPDGRWYAFESNRLCNNVGGNNYAIFILDTFGVKPLRQVSDCAKYNVQHPKWYPAGVDGISTKLIAAVALTASSNGLSSIGSFDVTNYVK
jgi:hypothetical protein